MSKEKNVDSGPVQPALQQANCYVQPGCQLYNQDCMETMQRIETGSVDLMLTDIPYGTTQNKWDILPNINEMWAEWERILKANGVWVFTSVQPMASEIILSKKDYFKTEIIWDKVVPSGHLNAKIIPMRRHENILVFAKENYQYNPQFKKRKLQDLRPNRKNSAKKLDKFYEQSNYGDAKRGFCEENDFSKIYPHSILEINNGNGWDKKNNIHPTQKPIDLFRWLIKTYSNENDLVFDGYSGSGTTAAACIKEKRHFIGAELSKEYFDKSVERLELLRSQPELF